MLSREANRHMVNIDPRLAKIMSENPRFSPLGYTWQPDGLDAFNTDEGVAVQEEREMDWEYIQGEVEAGRVVPGMPRTGDWQTEDVEGVGGMYNIPTNVPIGTYLGTLEKTIERYHLLQERQGKK